MKMKIMKAATLLSTNIWYLSLLTMVILVLVCVCFSMTQASAEEPLFNTGNHKVIRVGGVSGLNGITYALTADVNGDGSPDLLTTHYGYLTGSVEGGFDYVDGSGELSVCLNNGSGRFTCSSQNGFNGPKKIVAADLDRDGNLDLAVMNRQ